MSLFRSIGARLSLALALIVAGALAAVYLIVVPSLEQNLLSAKRSELEKALPGVARQLPRSPYLWQDYVQNAAQSANARVVIYEILYDGPPVALASAADSNQLESEDVADDRVAIRAAALLHTTDGTVTRGGQRYAEIAAPLDPDGPILLLSAPLHDSLGNVALVRRQVLLAGAGALLVAFAVGLVGAALLARRIRRLERAADRIAAGDFSQAVRDRGGDELGELAGAFDRMRLRLAQLEHARSEFIANASHELRTPLFALGGFVELLADEELEEATRREFLETMREQLERLTRLATDLLDLSRLDAGRLRVEREPVDLSALARSLVEEFGPVAHAGGHELEAVVGIDAAALADAQRVRQIGGVLIENALLHTPPGTPLRVRARSRADRAELVVEDEGPGIPLEHRDHVFERFYRVDGGVASGSGLGLAIARELAELMNGTITLASRPGRTEFVLALPRAGRISAFSRENAEGALAGLPSSP